jgi:glycosyltransferase involved in cell wall biosynthesis
MKPEVERDIEQQLYHQQEKIRQLQKRIACYRVLSTLPYTKVDFWTNSVETLFAKRNILTRFTRHAGIPDIFILFKLLARSRRYDFVLLTGGERVDLLYVAVASLIPWIRTPHIIVDAHWQKAKGAAYKLQRLLLRMAHRLIVQIQPHSPEEIPLYSRIFDLPLKQLYAVPWSTSLLGHKIPPANQAGKFILTGGFSFRDYDTIFKAIRLLDLPMEVGLPRSPATESVIKMARDCPNITIYTDWSNEQYLQKVAACRIFAMPIERGLTRCTADQTILNAMHLGKVVVSTDSIGPRLYIKHGVNGFLVSEGSVDAWVDTLDRAYRLSDEEYVRMAERAAYDARVHFNEPFRLARTLEAALQAVAGQPRQSVSQARPAARHAIPRSHGYGSN